MAGADPSADRAILIDFASDAPTFHVAYDARLRAGDVTLVRCTFHPNLVGVPLGSVQVAVALHVGSDYELEWHDLVHDRLRHQTIHSNEMLLAPADQPVFHRWTRTNRALVIALDRHFVTRTFTQAFEREAEDLPTVIGHADPIVQGLGALCDREISEHGAAGRLYAESLATALTVHLFHRYGAYEQLPRPITGGLSPLALRRVVALVEARLDEDLSLVELAKLTGLSTHHFAEAFKASTGTPPYHYVLERRVHRARELLLGGDLPIGAIAVRVGFATPSHLSFNFHRLTGATPSQYRRDHPGGPLPTKPRRR